MIITKEQISGGASWIRTIKFWWWMMKAVCVSW